jgi:2,4-dienoyl-CoA reductase-like NADH-dependent reductase (Old Yellow Enzyme family)
MAQHTEINLVDVRLGAFKPKLTSPIQAEPILVTGQADAVILARELLRDPHWPLRAARELGQPISWPVQFLRAAPEGSQARVAVDLKNLESCFEEQHAILERSP